MLFIWFINYPFWTALHYTADNTNDRSYLITEVICESTNFTEHSISLNDLSFASSLLLRPVHFEPFLDQNIALSIVLFDTKHFSPLPSNAIFDFKYLFKQKHWHIHNNLLDILTISEPSIPTEKWIHHDIRKTIRHTKYACDKAKPAKTKGTLDSM